ncbi:MAG: HAMP domain-containing histidine kinase [Desulfobulbaceae bacterium]|nr:HAMP domain-containing histidine kinase [Desulfobulbaceae bacterium]
MFSKMIERLTANTGFRLALWYSAIFISSSLLLFLLLFFPLRAEILERDHNMIFDKMQEYTLQDERLGLQVMIDEIHMERLINQQGGFFVRVVDLAGKPLISTLPPRWQAREDEILAALNRERDGDSWVVVPDAAGRDVLEIAEFKLASGHLLQVGKGSEERQKLLADFRRIFALVMLPVIILGFGGGFFLANRSLRPVRDLIQTLRSIDTGKLNARVTASPAVSELNELIQLFNGMLEKIEHLITGMRAALDNVAHDLRTPVTRLRAVIETAVQADGDSDSLREALMDCAEESERIVTMLNTLMDISEAETGVMRLNLETINAAGLLAEVVELYQYVAEEKGVAISLTVPADLEVCADPNRMRQVVGNLVDNALKYTPPGGRISIEARPLDKEMMLVIEDSGSGIAPHDLPQIFDRLYRADTSRSHRGLGLGLSLVKAVVQAHKGRIEVSSTPGRGSCFTLFWPMDFSGER